MSHYSFKPRTFEEAVDTVVGDCNGYTRTQRFELETPLFARAILRRLGPGQTMLLDYGCGVGRLAREILRQHPGVTVIGVDVSDEELALARQYVDNERFTAMKPWELSRQVDLVYCVYVLQHIPAIDVREALMRMHGALKDGGRFVCCTSLYRMALGDTGFWDDRARNHVDLVSEIERYFRNPGEPDASAREDLFTPEELGEHAILRAMVTGEGGMLPHPAWVLEKRALAGPVYNARPASERPAGLRRVILRSRGTPADLLSLTAAIRALHKAHPGRFVVDVDSPYPDLFAHNPYVTRLDGDGLVVDVPSAQRHDSAAPARHTADAQREVLARALDVGIPSDGVCPDIFLSQDENLWPSPVVEHTSEPTRYWLLDTGAGDAAVSRGGRWQQVVDLLNAAWQGAVKIVQIAGAAGEGVALRGVIPFPAAASDPRRLFRLVHKADGVLTSAPFALQIAAALRKPVVVMGGADAGMASCDMAMLGADTAAPSVVAEWVVRRQADAVVPTIDPPSAVSAPPPSPRRATDGARATNGPVAHLTGNRIEAARAATGRIFGILRALKELTPGDTYLEQYVAHQQAAGDRFFDQYHVAAWYGAHVQPRRVLEIGTRTGLSLAMLLATYPHYDALERVVSIDPYLDGYANPGIVRMNLKRLGIPLDRVDLRKGFSNDECAALIRERSRFDYILVDGDHSKAAALADLSLAEQLVDVDGVIVFDDIAAAGCGLADVWQQWAAQARTAVFECHQDLTGKGTAWAIRKQ